MSDKTAPISFASMCAGVWLGGGLKEQEAADCDRYLWRDIEREFNFKAAMRGKAMIKKRAEKAR